MFEADRAFVPPCPPAAEKNAFVPNSPLFVDAGEGSGLANENTGGPVADFSAIEEGEGWDLANEKVGGAAAEVSVVKEGAGCDLANEKLGGPVFEVSAIEGALNPVLSARVPVTEAIPALAFVPEVEPLFAPRVLAELVARTPSNGSCETLSSRKASDRVSAPEGAPLDAALFATLAKGPPTGIFVEVPALA